jgi:hypothetical protein
MEAPDSSEKLAPICEITLRHISVARDLQQYNNYTTNYTIKIVICINNAIITQNYGKPQDLFSSSKLPWARERISSKFVDNLGMRPQKSAPALVYGFYFLGFYVMSVLLSSLTGKLFL